MPNKMIFTRQANHEYQVTLICGTAYVFADCYEIVGNVYEFYHDGCIVQEFEEGKVVTVVQVW